MKNQNKIKLFEDKKVRTLWNEGEEQWYFSIVDVIEVLTESIDANAYWRKLKQRLKEEGNETVTNCHALNILSSKTKLCPRGNCSSTSCTNSRSGQASSKLRKYFQAKIILFSTRYLPNFSCHLISVHYSKILFFKEKH